jgi:hypothetical protein
MDATTVVGVVARKCVNWRRFSRRRVMRRPWALAIASSNTVLATSTAAVARVPTVLEDADVALPDPLRHMLALVYDDIRALEHRIEQLERMLAVLADACQQLVEWTAVRVTQIDAGDPARIRRPRNLDVRTGVQRAQRVVEVDERR